MFKDRLFTLWKICGVGSALPARLVAVAPDLAPAKLKELAPTCTKRERAKLEQFLATDSNGAIEKLLDVRSTSRVVAVGGQSTFSDLSVPPLFLFVRGNIELLSRAGVAVVGSRKADTEAMRLVSKVVKAFPSETIISGGALGIDAGAHREALELGSATVAILPGDVEGPTPKTNTRLFNRILENGGLLVSEYPPGTHPRPYHFHRRNQLIAALCHTLVIVRAEKESGTLITAEAAIKLRRKLLAIPGSPLDPLAEGCNALISKGHAELFLAEGSPPPLPVGELEIKILSKLPSTLSELLIEFGFDAGEVMVALTELELRGVVWKNRQTGQYIATT